jgi:hypothetical protein
VVAVSLDSTQHYPHTQLSFCIAPSLHYFTSPLLNHQPPLVWIGGHRSM